MRLARDMALLVAAAAILGLCVNLVHPKGYAPAGRSAAGAAVRISAEEGKIKYDAGVALFIDAREKDEFDRGRIQGALCVPILDASAGGADFSFLERPREIVIYCDGPSCGASDRLAGIIRARGYRRSIYVLDDGFPGWASRGYPVEEGK